MNIIVNGFSEEVPTGSTIAQLIVLFQEEHPELIAELNGGFVHPGDYPTTVVDNGATVEFVNAAFGG